MVIIPRYKLKYKQEIQAFVLIVDEDFDTDQIRCPYCNGQLKYRDSKKRIWQKAGGEKDYIIIPRLKCESCGKLHNELPDCLIPYKHYGAEMISDVLNGVITQGDGEVEDYPCPSTIQGWFWWFHCIFAIIEATLRRLVSSVFGPGKGKDILAAYGSYVHAMQEHYQDWLGRCIRLLYASGGSLRIRKE